MPLSREPTADAGNALLACLKDGDRARIGPLLEEHHLKRGSLVLRSGDLVEHCYFPTGSAAFSCFVDFQTGVTVETLLVGREGALGGVVGPGMFPAFANALVLQEGRCLRIGTRALGRLKSEAPGIGDLLARYADCVMAQLFQSIACNAAHSIEQRAARWLTAAVERTASDEVVMTQEQLAGLMGIGRSYASRVLQRFKREGILRTRRGSIEIVDRRELSRYACPCNDRVAAHFDAVLHSGKRIGA